MGKLVRNNPSVERRSKIARIGVAKAYRQRGIGSALVKTIGKHLSCEMSDIGWELPLTSDGKILIRKLIPGHWWGRGDSFALQETLSGSR
jgi:GNAT superfamily N-acetyltransferase